MDPDYPDEEKKGRHRDVEFGQWNLSGRQEAVRIFLLDVNLEPKPRDLFIKYHYIQQKLCLYTGASGIYLDTEAVDALYINVIRHIGVTVVEVEVVETLLLLCCYIKIKLKYKRSSWVRRF